MNEHLEFWKNNLIKGAVMGGFTFFSIVATLDLTLAFKPSVIAGGTYVFVEAMKYYQLQPDKKVSKGTYSFLI